MPVNFMSTVVNGNDVDLTWELPVYDGGSPITGYVIRTVSDEGVASAWTTLNTNSDNLSASITGLDFAALLIYQIAAREYSWYRACHQKIHHLLLVPLLHLVYL